jgi:predicted 3-demethylubiquinone-9 3-methyltransferase (glyoxalase superfamily)
MQKITTFLTFNDQAEAAVKQAMLAMNKLDLAKLQRAYDA